PFHLEATAMRTLRSILTALALALPAAACDGDGIADVPILGPIVLYFLPSPATAPVADTIQGIAVRAVRDTSTPSATAVAGLSFDLAEDTVPVESLCTGCLVYWQATGGHPFVTPTVADTSGV